MKHLMHYLLFSVVCLLTSSTIYAQTEVSADKLTAQWELMKESNDVQLSVRTESCDLPGSKKNLEYAFINLVNNSNQDRTVLYQVAVQYNTGCSGCDANLETVKSITVPANSSVSTDCKFDRGELSVLIKNPNLNDTRVFESLKLIQFKVD